METCKIDKELIKQLKDLGLGVVDESVRKPGRRFTHSQYPDWYHECLIPYGWRRPQDKRPGDLTLDSESSDDDEDEESLLLLAPPAFVRQSSLFSLTSQIIPVEDVRKLRIQHVTDTASWMRIEEGQAEALLRYLRYDMYKLAKCVDQPKYLNQICKASGMRLKAPKRSTEEFVKCGSCYSTDVFPRKQTHALACGHHICDQCWHNFLRHEIDFKGPNCLFSTCPALITPPTTSSSSSSSSGTDTSKDSSGPGRRGLSHSSPSLPQRCREVVDLKTMSLYLDLPDMRKLNEWVTAYFVSCSPLHSFCPHPDCKDLIYCEEKAVPVECSHGHTFCFKCGEPPHQPCPCKIVRRWNDLTRDASTHTWLQRRTKPCPTCGTRIERTRICNHLRCTVCNYEFCWECMQTITIGSNHPSWYVCSTQRLETGRDSHRGSRGKDGTRGDHSWNNHNTNNSHDNSSQSKRSMNPSKNHLTIDERHHRIASLCPHHGPNHSPNHSPHNNPNNPSRFTSPTSGPLSDLENKSNFLNQLENYNPSENVQKAQKEDISSEADPSVTVTRSEEEKGQEEREKEEEEEEESVVMDHQVCLRWFRAHVEVGRSDMRPALCLSVSLS